MNIECGRTSTAAREPSKSLRLFGVEIGGPEDGFQLTDAAPFLAAKQLGAGFVDIRPIWSTIEERPGVYNWGTIDMALRHASSVGLPVTLTMRFFDGQIPDWLRDEDMVDQDGRGFFGYSGENSRNPSYWGPDSTRSYLGMIEALVKRYRSNGLILAWQFFYGYNDSFYLGMWNREAVYDYSEFSQAKYREYLRKVKGLSLKVLADRYGRKYRRWQDVLQPTPAFGKLNSTLAWHDFQDYRMWSIERMFRRICLTVRALDDRPLIIYYGGSLHHSAHQLSVYDVGLRLLSEFGGALDITCYEDPVPAEVGSGIVRSYGIPLMAEAWQVPPPLPDFRRLFFHAFSQGVSSYQLVGSWERMQASPQEFRRMRSVFEEVSLAKPVRIPVAGLVSYRTILSHIPARHYINPTLAIIPALQELQFSLDWHSDFGPMDDLRTYIGVLDANSEVLGRTVMEGMVDYVEGGGRLVLLPRSGRICLDNQKAEYPLLDMLSCPGRQATAWNVGDGAVLRYPKDPEWRGGEGRSVLLDMMDWIGAQRPVVASPGVLACLSEGAGETLYATLFWPGSEPFEASVSVRGLPAPAYRVANLLRPEDQIGVVEGSTLEEGLTILFEAYELKALRIGPVT